jgi:hypothetical protein
VDDSTIRAAPGPSQRVRAISSAEDSLIRATVPSSEIAAWIGIDWADQQYIIRLQVGGADRVESYVVEQEPKALQAWVSQLGTRVPQGLVPRYRNR